MGAENAETAIRFRQEHRKADYFRHHSDRLTDATVQKARYIDEILRDAKNSIRQIAYLCSENDVLTSGLSVDILSSMVDNLMTGECI